MLKVKLMRYKTLVFGEILEQGEETARGCGKVFKHNDFYIMPESQPSLSADAIYIKGLLREEDNRVICRLFDTESEAKEYIHKCAECINAYNASLTSETPTEEIETYIIGG